MRVNEEHLQSTVQFAHAVASFLGENKAASDAFQAFMFDRQNGSGAWNTLTPDQQIGMHEDHITGIAAAQLIASAFMYAVTYVNDSTPPFVMPPIHMTIGDPTVPDGLDHSNCLAPERGYHAIDCPANPHYER